MSEVRFAGGWYEALYDGEVIGRHLTRVAAENQCTRWSAARQIAPAASFTAQMPRGSSGKPRAFAGKET